MSADDIKEILRTLLSKLGGSATVRELRQSFFNEYYCEMDPWKYQVNTIVELLKLFPDVFNLVSIDGVEKVVLKSQVADKPKTSKEQAVTMLKQAEFQSKFLNPARIAESPSAMSLKSVATAAFLKDIAEFPRSTPLPSQVVSECDSTLNTLDDEGIFDKIFKDESKLMQEDEESLAMSLLEMSLSTVSKNYEILEESASEAEDPLDMALMSECSSNTIPQKYQLLLQIDSDIDASEWDENYEFDADEEGPIYDCKVEPSDEDIKEPTSSEPAAEPTITKQLSASLDPKDYIASLAVDDPVFLLGFEEVMQDPKIQLPFQKLPEGEMDIYISEVFSPIQFWFQQGVEIERVMDRLETVYKQLSKRALIISEKNIQPGLLVACYLKEFKDWHRAMVINRIDEKGNARLFFLDYGTVGFVKLHNIKYLFKTFLKYPRMAHRGRFHNLKPPTNPIAWSEGEVNALIIKVANKKFKAVVLKTDEERAHEIEIIWNGESLREWLINQKLALPFDFNNPKHPNSTYPMCYFSPTFEMLENNYPTFSEKSLMSARGIDFDLLLETNFLTCVSMKKLKSSPKLIAMLSLEEFKDAKEFYFADV